MKNGKLIILAVAFALSLSSFAFAGEDGVHIGSADDSLEIKNYDQDSVVIIPNISGNLSIFRLVGNPGKNQSNQYNLVKCESDPNSDGPLISTCKDAGKHVLNENIEVAPGFYFVKYSGTVYQFTIAKGEKIETRLTRIVYPHNLGDRISLAVNHDYESENFNTLLAMYVWGLYGSYFTLQLNSFTLKEACEKVNDYSISIESRISDMTMREFESALCSLDTNTMTYKDIFRTYKDRYLFVRGKEPFTRGVQFRGYKINVYTTYGWRPCVNGSCLRFSIGGGSKEYSLVDEYSYSGYGNPGADFAKSEDVRDYDRNFKLVYRQSFDQVEIESGDFVSVLPGVYNIKVKRGQEVLQTVQKIIEDRSIVTRN